MAKPNVKLNLKGVNEIMKSAEVEADLMRRGRKIAAAAGPGFEAVSEPHKWIARVYVQAETHAARRAEAKDRVLSRALDAGRGE